MQSDNHLNHLLRIGSTIFANHGRSRGVAVPILLAFVNGAWRRWSQDSFLLAYVGRPYLAGYPRLGIAQRFARQKTTRQFTVSFTRSYTACTYIARAFEEYEYSSIKRSLQALLASLAKMSCNDISASQGKGS